MTTATTITKFCNSCKQQVPITEFHFRSAYRGKLEIPTESKHVISECKTCMRNRSKVSKRLSPHETRTESETWFIEYLASYGIPALPGKALRDSDVDVVALGHVWIETKMSTLRYDHYNNRFAFSFSPRQVEQGPRGHIIALICDWNTHRTVHLFQWDNKVFFNEYGKMKTGISFVPGQMEAIKHVRRHILTQPIMDRAQDRIELISTYITRIHNALCSGQRPDYGKPFGR